MICMRMSWCMFMKCYRGMLASGKINPWRLLEICKYSIRKRCWRITLRGPKLGGRDTLLVDLLIWRNKLSWGWNSVAGDDELCWRNKLRLGDEICWLACDYEPWPGIVISCFGEADINAFGYFYFVGSVYTNNYVPKLALSRYLMGRVTIGFGTSCFSLFLELWVIVFCFLCKYLWASIIFKCIYKK